MSAYVVVKCDRDWLGFPCRGAITLPQDAVDNHSDRRYVVERGWSVGHGTAACPAHTLAEKTLEAAR